MNPPAEFDSHYLKEIHRHIFQDAFEWAGHTRDVPFIFADGTTASMPTMRKEGAKVSFASGYQIQKGLEAFDNTLKERDTRVCRHEIILEVLCCLMSIFTEDCFIFPSHRRHDLTDHQWSLLAPHLLGQAGSWGGVARDNR